MKKFYIFQWINSDKLYVKKTYCGRIVCSSHKMDALRMDKKTAEKYLLKLQKINPYAELSIRELL